MQRKEAQKLGLKTYNTGKPCAHHPENVGGCERYTNNGNCVVMNNLRAIKWGQEHPQKIHAAAVLRYQANQEEIKASVKTWREKNLEYARNKRRERYRKNRDKEIAAVRAWQAAHPERVRAIDKARYARNPSKRAANTKQWEATHAEQAKETHRKWRAKNRERINREQKKKRDTDINFKLATNLRARLRLALQHNQKAGSAVSDLGCTIEELKVHLESKFQPGMTWENYGNKAGCWSIDHIRPLVSFDLTNRQQFLEACNYKNLQPLWHIENMKKGAKYHNHD